MENPPQKCEIYAEAAISTYMKLERTNATCSVL